MPGPTPTPSRRSRAGASALGVTLAVALTGIVAPARADGGIDTWSALTAAFTGAGTTATTITLDNATPITNPSGANLAVPSGGHVTLDLDGHNLTIGDVAAYSAGIAVPSDATLTVVDSSGGGELDVTGGQYSAGIGSTEGAANGTVTIGAAKVAATGGAGQGSGGFGGGAGIGAGLDGSGGTVTFKKGAKVTATGGLNASAVGAGDQSDDSGTFTNNGGLTLPSGSTLDVRNHGSVTNNGTIYGSGKIRGAVANHGTIRSTVQVQDSSAISDHGYIFNFHVNGQDGTPPAPMYVFARTVTASGQSLPALDDPNFTGWATTADGGTPIDDHTDLGATATTGSNDLYADPTWGNLTTAVAGGGTVTLDEDLRNPAGHQLAVPADSSVTLDLHGHDLTIGDVTDEDAGIEVPSGSTLTVEDTVGGGSLTTTGADGGAGIGGSKGEGAGTVVISSGQVTATGTVVTGTGQGGAGIGGGSNGSGGDVTIEQPASVTATGGGAGGASAIGPGYASTSTGTFTNNGTLTLPQGSKLRIPDGTTATNAGTIENDGQIYGNGGELINTGAIANGPDALIAYDGDGADGDFLISGHNYTVAYDLNGQDGDAIPDQHVYAPTLDAAGLDLPTVDNDTFTGWYTTSTGGTAFDSGSTLTGTGPTTITQYAGTEWNRLENRFAAGGTVTLQGDAHSAGPTGLVVAPSGVTLDLNGHTLTIDGLGHSHAGITVRGNRTLTIEDTSAAGTGKLDVSGGTNDNVGSAGIGGDGDDASDKTYGSITIDSGTVIAQGGSFSAGIGGGDWGVPTNSTVTIAGGVVDATGGAGGVGIGGGFDSTGGTVHITGGDVTAHGGGYGAGIGSGTSGSTSTEIDGGTVTAVGGPSFSGQNFGGTGIGGSAASNSTDVTIGGGTVSTTGGPQSAGIGTAYEGYGGNVTIDAGAQVTAIGGATPSGDDTEPAIGVGEEANGPETITNNGTLTLPTHANLVLPSGQTITNGGTITGTGAINGTGTLANSGTVKHTVTVADSSTVTGDNYTVSYDLGALPGNTPATRQVYAKTLADAGLALPAKPDDHFAGWFAAGSKSKVTTSTDLSTLAGGAGPADIALHAYDTQKITFTSTAPDVADAGDTYTPVATSSSGLTVKFAASGRCTITDGTVHFNKAGSCTIKANQAGNTTYRPAKTVTQTVTIHSVAPTLTADVEGTTPNSTTNGWYRSASVTVTFTCTAGSAPVSSCPKPLTYTGDGTHSVNRTIRATDGGTDSVSVTIRIDHTKPKLTVTGVTNHTTYDAQPAITCTATDATSGIWTTGGKRCTITRTKGTVMPKMVVWHYSVTARDKAGNVITRTGTYNVRS